MNQLDATLRLGDHARIITLEECWELVRSATYGRLVFVDQDHHPIALPVTHAVDDETVVFRSIPGTKLGASATGSPVTFQVDDFDPTGPRGWSILVKGRATLVSDEADLASLLSLELDTWTARNLGGTVWVRIVPTEVTGIRLEPPAAPTSVEQNSADATTSR